MRGTGKKTRVFIHLGAVGAGRFCLTKSMSTCKINLTSRDGLTPTPTCSEQGGSKDEALAATIPDTASARPSSGLFYVCNLAWPASTLRAKGQVDFI